MVAHAIRDLVHLGLADVLSDEGVTDGLGEDLRHVVDLQEGVVFLLGEEVEIALALEGLVGWQDVWFGLVEATARVLCNTHLL